jgi:hypothetical protein
MTLQITIMNYHECSLSVNFFCHTIGNSSEGETCKRTKLQKEKRQNRRATNFEYVRLVLAARKQGLLKEGVDLVRAAALAEAFHETDHNLTMKNFPLDCLEQELVDVLWEASLKEEREMVPDWHLREGGEAEFEMAFRLFNESLALTYAQLT